MASRELTTAEKVALTQGDAARAAADAEALVTRWEEMLSEAKAKRDAAREALAAAQRAVLVEAGEDVKPDDEFALVKELADELDGDGVKTGKKLPTGKLFLEWGA